MTEEFPQKRFYTPEEVASYFGDISADTIRELCRTHKIPGARQIGRKWFIPRSYLFGEEKQKNDKNRQT